MIFTLITSPSENPSENPLKSPKKQYYRFSSFSNKKTEPNRTETGRFEPVPVRVRFEFLSFSKFDFG